MKSTTTGCVIIIIFIIFLFSTKKKKKKRIFYRNKHNGNNNRVETYIYLINFLNLKKIKSPHKTAFWQRNPLTGKKKDVAFIFDQELFL